MAKYVIKSGVLKGVGLKNRHTRLLKREFKKTLRFYVGRRTALAAGAAAALVGRQVKALRGRRLSAGRLRALPEKTPRSKVLPGGKDQ
ncbi:MAG: hypothetical protein IIY89_09340 [Clostridia bacterium]|nr:hypothetical protein [Clostridia bacterium]